MPLKGHGNEVDFLGFLQKLVPHRSLTLTFEPFRFWLQIRGDIRNQKTTPQLGKSGSRRVGQLAFECLKENSPSRRVGDSPTWRVGELLRFENNFLTVECVGFTSKIIFFLSNVFASLRK
jgi:hypothetical protein